MKAEGTREANARRSWRASATSGAGILAAIGVALLFAGSAAAAPAVLAAGKVTDTAPYTGEEFGAAFLDESGCGVTGAIVVAPYFNLTTGQSYASLNLSATACGTPSSEGDMDEESGFVLAAFTGVGGSYHVKATWELNLSVSLAAKPGSSSSAAAFYSVEPIVAVFDETNGSFLGPSTHAELFHEITSGTYSHTYSKLKVTQYSNQTLKKSNSYEIETYVLVETYVFVTAPSSTAGSFVNMGIVGKDADLLSLTFP